MIGSEHASAMVASDEVATSAPAGTPLLVAEDVSKAFGGIPALTGVNFAAHAGEVHALVGENGAGKSTLAKILSGAQRADRGSLFCRGAKVDFGSPRDAQRAGIATVHQEMSLCPHLSVVENLFLGCYPHRRGRIDWRRMSSAGKEVFDRLGVKLDLDTPCRALNRGTSQLVEIGRALMLDANTLLLDEPTASLTDAEVSRLHETIRDLCARGCAVVYISHRLDDVLSIADRITVLRNGVRVNDWTRGVTSTEIVQAMAGHEVVAESARRSSRSSGPVLLQLSDVSSTAFEHVELEIHAGTVLGFAGLAGCGASELLEAVAGFTPLTGGELCSGTGDADNNAETYPRIALVPGDRARKGLLLTQSVAENMSITVPKRISVAGLVQHQAESALANTMTGRLDIRPRDPWRPVGTLSGGNQQKVVFAKALVQNPEILALDDPTVGVDVGAKAELYRLVEDFTARGGAAVWYSSDLKELLAVADEIVVMRNGRIAGRCAPTAAAEDVLALAVGAESEV